MTELAVPDDSYLPGSDVSLGEWFLACRIDILGLMDIWRRRRSDPSQRRQPLTSYPRTLESSTTPSW